MVRTIDFNKLRDNAKKVENTNQRTVDARMYKLDRNEDGNAFAIIRFLPQVEGEETFFAMKYSHFFTENGKTYSELCPTIVGEQCPVCEHNREHWKNYGPIEKARKRKVRYFTNILVVKDKEHQDREGENFLYEFGDKIHKKISNAIYDNDEEGTKGYDVFDFMKGKNFKLKIKTVSEFANYDDSEFISEPSPVFGGDEKKINALDKKIYSLAEFIPKKETMKSYEELKAIFLSKISPNSDQSQSQSPSNKPSSNSKPTSQKVADNSDEGLFVDDDNKKKEPEQDFFLGD